MDSLSLPTECYSNSPRLIRRNRKKEMKLNSSMNLLSDLKKSAYFDQNKLLACEDFNQKIH